MNPKPLPAYRNLRGYTLDPGFSTLLDTSLINETIYRIKWEPVKPGPVGEYFEVIDIDPPSNCFYAPVDLNSVEVLADSGLNPSEGDPQFHQQLVYVIGMRTIQFFEQALGRKILWSIHKDQPMRDRLSQMQSEQGKEKEIIALRKELFKKEYVHRLRIYPHAFRGANAYYDANKKAVLFGYFEAGRQISGANFPGGVVFTCLSPDIVAHEITHAILDGIHPRFMENTNIDVPAFHEAFADLVSLLQRFTITDLVEHQLARSGGNLDEFNLLGELATQFGNARDRGRGALRSAIGEMTKDKGWTAFRPDATAYESRFEAHQRGALLVAVVFDAFIRLYKFKTKDLFRIAGINAYNNSQAGNQNINMDLVVRLAAEAGETARHLLLICIRALDYCPPLDITFGDYLRALITADKDIAPADNQGYRLALIEAFRSWGIFPDRVNTLSVESLAWTSQPYTLNNEENESLRNLCRFLRPSVRNLLDIQDREELAKATQHVQAGLHTYLTEIQDTKPGELAQDAAARWDNFLFKLGLTNQPVTQEYNGKQYTSPVPDLEVHQVRPAFRTGREGRQVDQVIVTITQTLKLSDTDMSGYKFRGGCTLILNMSGGYYVEYILVKNIRSKWRFSIQADYQFGKSSNASAFTDSMYEDDAPGSKINFAHLHAHND